MSRVKTHEDRDWFYFLIILPALACTAVERRVREVLAECKAARERWPQ